ncbi:MAG: hypothetical protein ACYDHZ_00945 [Dehalococcoidia bacterium]
MAKYDSIRKTERNRELYELHLATPELSYAELGKRYDITGSRAHEIIQNEERRRKVAVK